MIHPDPNVGGEEEDASVETNTKAWYERGVPFVSLFSIPDCPGVPQVLQTKGKALFTPFEKDF